MTGRVVSLAEAASRIERERARGRRIVTTNGVFDLLHGGHRYLFAECRKLGDVLVVGVNSDASVKALKGPRRPFQSQDTRARRVARLADLVFVFDDRDPAAAVRVLRPDVHVTADTYRDRCPEAGAVAEVGADLAFVPVIAGLGSSTQRLSEARRRNTRLWAAVTWVVSPVLRACAALRRPAPRILVVPRNGIGDVVQVSPFIRAIKQSHPDLAVDVLTISARAPVAEANPYVDAFLPLQGRRAPLLVRLWRRRYACVVVFSARTFLRTLGVWVCAPRRIGAWWEESSGPWTDAFCTRVVARRRGESGFDHAMRVANALDAAPVAFALDYVPPPSARDGAAQWLATQGLSDGSFVVVNPSAGEGAKEWPINRWAELLGRLVGDGRRVVVSTGSAAAARELCAAVDRAGAVFDASMLSLAEAAVVSARAACFVSVDTGPLYTAYAAGAHIVAILGATDPFENLPPATLVYPDDGADTSVEAVLGGVAAALGSGSAPLRADSFE